MLSKVDTFIYADTLFTYTQLAIYVTLHTKNMRAVMGKLL